MSTSPEAVRTSVGLVSAKKPSSAALRLGISYLLVTIALFTFGPFVWPLPSMTPVLVYLSVLIGMLYVGHRAGLSRPPLHAPMPLTRVIFVFGAISAIVLLFPSAITYTGRWPWEVLEALADQREAYGKLSEQIAETQGARGFIILPRSLTYPFVFAVLPLGVLYWRSLTLVQRMLLVATILCSIIFSILRGTTRELADVVVIGGSALLVSIFRETDDLALRERRIKNAAFRMAGIVVAVLLILMIRTGLRAGDTVSVYSGCINDTRACVDYARLPFSVLPSSLNNFISTITGYLAQGYYGLALALNEDFQWTKGIGHSPAVQSLYELATGDQLLAGNSYTNRLVFQGWSGQTQWSSLPTWLASDLSFWLVPGTILLLGYFWARTWVDATLGRDDHAAIFFCALMMVIFYFPANNQMMITLDNYAALVGWMFAWGFTRRNATQVAG